MSESQLIDSLVESLILAADRYGKNIYTPCRLGFKMNDAAENYQKVDFTPVA